MKLARPLHTVANCDFRQSRVALIGPGLTVRRIAASTVALIGVTAIVACSSGTGDTAETAGEGIDGGVVRIAINQDLSPATFYTGASDTALTVAGLAYDSLIDYPVDSLEPEPSIATGWDVSEDGLAYTLDLRDDVTFHDGRALTSEDVQASLETYADPARAGQLASTAAKIVEYDTENPHEVTLTLEEPANNLFDLLDLVPIIDKDDVEGFLSGENYNGTGAFHLTEWNKGSELIFESNDEYWGGAPSLDGVELSLVPDPQTQISQLRSGQLDLLPGVGPRDRGDLEESPDFTVRELVGVDYPTYIGANVDVPGLDDVRVRQAIAYAVDRDRILQEVYQGYGTVINLPWPEYSPAYDEESNSRYTRDLEKARELVEEVGQIPEITLTYAPEQAQIGTVAQIVADNLNEVGIDVKLEGVEPATALSNLRNGTNPGLWITQHTFSQYNPSTLVTSAFPFNAQKNGSNFVDEGYAEHVGAAVTALDPSGAEALEAYRAVNDDLLENAFVIELVSSHGALVHTSALDGVSWSKKGELNLSEAYFTE